MHGLRRARSIFQRTSGKKKFRALNWATFHSGAPLATEILAPRRQRRPLGTVYNAPRHRRALGHSFIAPIDTTRVWLRVKAETGDEPEATAPGPK